MTTHPLPRLLIFLNDEKIIDLTELVKKLNLSEREVQYVTKICLEIPGVRV